MPDDYSRFKENSKNNTRNITGLLFKTEVIARNTDRIVEDVQKHLTGTRTVYTQREDVYSISGDMSADDIMRESRRLHTQTPQGGYTTKEERWEEYTPAKERGRGTGVDLGNEVTYTEPEYRPSNSSDLLPKQDPDYTPEPARRNIDSIKGRDERSFFEAHSSPNYSQQSGYFTKSTQGPSPQGGFGKESPSQTTPPVGDSEATVNPLKTSTGKKYDGWPPKPHDDKFTADGKALASSSENRWLKPRLKTTVYGDKPMFYAGPIKTATDESNLQNLAEKGRKTKDAQEKAAAVRETQTNGKRSFLHTATGRAIAKNQKAEDLTERAKRKRGTKSKKADGFATLVKDKNGKKKLSSASGTIIGQSIHTSTSKDKTKATKTKITTSVKDGKMIRRVEKQTQTLGLKKTRMFTKGSRKLLTGTSVVVGGANKLAKGIQDGDTSEFTKTVVKHTAGRALEKPVRKAGKKATRAVLKAIKAAVKVVMAMIKKLVLALIAIASPVVIIIIVAVAIILSLCIWGFSVDGSEKDWDKYSDYICAVEDGLEDDIKDANTDTITIKGRPNIEWKGLFAIAQTFYDGDGDFETVDPVLEWAYSSDNSGRNGYTSEESTGLNAEEQENPALANARNPSLPTNSNHLYKIEDDDGKKILTFYGYNHILKDFSESKLWKDRIKKQKMPDISKYYIDEDTDYEEEVSIGTGDGLTVGVSADDLLGTAGDAKKLISVALSKQGCPYVWGAKGPNSFDCSGFVYWCIRNSLDKNFSYLGSKAWGSASQYQKIEFKDLKPGDILVFSNNGQQSGVHHVGIYIGNGQMVHSPQSGDVVKKSDITSGNYKNQFYLARRICADDVENTDDGKADTTSNGKVKVGKNTYTAIELQSKLNSLGSLGCGAHECGVWVRKAWSVLGGFNANHYASLSETGGQSTAYGYGHYLKCESNAGKPIPIGADIIIKYPGGGAGHIGIYLGNNKYISWSGSSIMIREVKGGNNGTKGTYAGWCWHHSGSKQVVESA